MRKHTLKTRYSNHNKRKLSILLSCFNEYMTVFQVAEDTFSDSLGVDFEHHIQNVRESLWKYRHAYTHPYVDSKKFKKGLMYRANEKGRRVCCELYFRKMNGLDLNWKHSKRHYNKGKGRGRWNKYNIECSDSCKNCKFNPTKPTKIIKKSVLGKLLERNKALKPAPPKALTKDDVEKLLSEAD